MPVDQYADLTITCFDWVPPFARGRVRDLRIRWFCEETGLSYAQHRISAIDRPASHFEHQPFGQVPVLLDGDIEIFESGAILLHLAEREGKLLPPAGQARASALSWLFAAFNSLEPSVFELGNVTIFNAKEEWAALRKPSLLNALGGRLDGVARGLGEAEWLAGVFSIADIAMATVLREVPDDLLEARPALASYRDRALARPAFLAARDAQLDAFSAEPAT